MNEPNAYHKLILKNSRGEFRGISNLDRGMLDWEIGAVGAKVKRKGDGLSAGSTDSRTR